jgi:hypothetical protein
LAEIAWNREGLMTQAKGSRESRRVRVWRCAAGTREDARRAAVRALLVMGVVIVSGCVTTPALRTSRPLPPGPAAVILFPPDVELSELTAGGLQEPRADWTEAGLANVTAGLRGVLAAHESSLVPYREPKEDPERLLAEEFDADYGLFVYLHDSYASGARVAAMLAAAVFLRIGLQGGIQVGFASLVDLRTGDVVWFNHLVSTTGDLRTPEPALRAVGLLLKDLPL